ncbi:MAG: hypothetical protein N4A33_06695 [Bacteriovoracaceae bacterium]|jgi:hypothetical protein|nr:hypothetical protein [Bacteriovoracaceae bacterium]
MIRFLKYIFLIFGGLAALIITFFYIQNKEDLSVAYNYKNKLDYDVILKTCKSDLDKSYYKCFEREFNDYASQVSLTGLSLGLKLAFNFLEEDKKKADFKYPNIISALNHLKINNIVIKNTMNRFHGFDFTYGGYIGKMRDFLDKAREFSDNLIKGLKEDKEGLSSIREQNKKSDLKQELLHIENEYKRSSKTIEAFIKSEIKRLKHQHGVS